MYRGPFDVVVETVDDPRIEQPNDAIIKITTANICGSGLHPYEGRLPLDAGMVLGHENMAVRPQPTVCVRVVDGRVQVRREEVRSRRTRPVH